MKRYIILTNIRSAHNVGSIFRTADGAGVEKIFLVGYTPHPIDRFGRQNQEIAKTALGAIDTVPWESYESFELLAMKLKAENVSLVAVEQHASAVDYRTLSLERDSAFVFGNEIEGVSTAVCESADVIIHIPMHGTKESLNIAVAVGIVLFYYTP